MLLLIPRNRKVDPKLCITVIRSEESGINHHLFLAEELKEVQVRIIDA